MSQSRIASPTAPRSVRRLWIPPGLDHLARRAGWRHPERVRAPWTTSTGTATASSSGSRWGHHPTVAADKGEGEAEDADRAGRGGGAEATRAPDDRPPATRGNPLSAPSRRCSTTASHAVSSWCAGAGERRPATRYGCSTSATPKPHSTASRLPPRDRALRHRLLRRGRARSQPVTPHRGGDWTRARPWARVHLDDVDDRHASSVAARASQRPRRRPRSRLESSHARHARLDRRRRRRGGEEGRPLDARRRAGVHRRDRHRRGHACDRQAPQGRRPTARSDPSAP